MSQNLVRFPSTRLMNADYGGIFPKDALHQLLDENPYVGKGLCLVGPHQTISRPVHKHMSLSERQESVKNELAQQISSLERSIACQEERVLGAEPVVKTLLATARKDPAGVANAVCYSRINRMDLVKIKRRRKLICAYGSDCGQVTLPFSKYCLHHQCSDYKQLLYPSCSGVDPNSLLKCNRTVLDIFSEASLCCKHSSEALSSGLTKRKTPYTQPRPVQKKPKAGAAKAVRKGGTMQTKVRLKLKADPKVGGALCQEGTSTAASVIVTESVAKATPPSKSLDDLLTLTSSLTAPLPKLDLLPLKADIGEIMMAGEDSSNDDSI